MGKQAQSGKKREKTHNKFYVNQIALEAVQVFTYLGVDFHATGAVPVSNNSMTLKEREHKHGWQD